MPHHDRCGNIQAIERLVRERIIMQYTTLGNTGLLVSRLSLGTMTFGGGEGLSKVIGGAGRDLERELVPLLEAEKMGLLVWSRLPAACSPVSSTERIRSRETRAALSSTFPSWTKSAPGRSSRRWLQSRKLITAAQRVFHWHGC